MSVATYLMSRPGRPLHLAIYAYDRPSIHASYPTVRLVPICGQDRGAQWQMTGPWAERWESHRRGGVCRHCLAALAALTEATEAVATNG